MFQRLLQLCLIASQPRRPKKSLRAQLAVELLEHRCVPVVVSTWKAAAAGNWSDPKNWTNGVPQAAGDQAIFDGTSNANCTQDIAGTQGKGITLAVLSITGTYSGTITLNNPIVLWNGTSQMNASATAILTGNQTLELSTPSYMNNTIFNWSAGIMDVPGTTQTATSIIKVDQGAVLNIQALLQSVWVYRHEN